MSLESAIVPPRTPNADERRDIIDAAYGCLYAPHQGPVSVAAILDAAGHVHPGLLPALSSKDELFLAMLKREAMRSRAARPRRRRKLRRAGRAARKRGSTVCSGWRTAPVVAHTSVVHGFR